MPAPTSPGPHTRFVADAFEFEPLPAGKDQMGDGLIVLFATSGKTSAKEVHRASCPVIADVAENPALMRNRGRHPIRFGGVHRSDRRCTTCGTDTLPLRALFWGETEQVVAEREAAARVEGLIHSRDRELAHAAAVARQIARDRVLAEHAAQVDAITAEHTALLQAQVHATYADLIPAT